MDRNRDFLFQAGQWMMGEKYMGLWEAIPRSFEGK